MRRSLHPLILLTACAAASDPNGNEQPVMKEEVVPDSVTVVPIHHSALALQWNGTTVLVDPHDAPIRYARFHHPDLVLITDIHGDHLDTTVLHDLDLSGTDLVVPQAVFDLLPQDLRSHCTIVANGGTTERKGIPITAIPMYNLSEDRPYHARGRGNGYVVTFGDQRVYISGDTEDIPEMRALRDIDIAFVCMNLPYTMTVDQAASGVLAFKPKVVYPYHYRGQDGLSDVGRFKEIVQAGDPHIEVRLADWYGDR